MLFNSLLFNVYLGAYPLILGLQRFTQDSSSIGYEILITFGTLQQLTAINIGLTSALRR